MKGTKKFFTLLIFSLFFIAVGLTGCSDPVVGSLAYSLDYIKAEPSKTIYGEKSWFKPAQEVKVLGVFGGVEETIHIDNVKIKIIEDPHTTPNVIPVLDNQDGCFFEYQGPKWVVITYRDKETHYDIAVGEPGVGGVGWGNSGGTGITIDYW
jgi:hypothetical protein